MKLPFKNLPAFQKLFKWEKKPGPPAAEAPRALRMATASVQKEQRRGVGGMELRHGTRHFRGGAKVHIIDNYPGMCEAVVVIGHERHTGRYIQLSMRVARLEDFRVTTVYSPRVLQMVHEHYHSRNSCYDEERAEYFCNASREWVGWLNQRKAERKVEREAGQGSSPPLA